MKRIALLALALLTACEVAPTAPTRCIVVGLALSPAGDTLGIVRSSPVPGWPCK